MAKTPPKAKVNVWEKDPATKMVGYGEGTILNGVKVGGRGVG